VLALGRVRLPPLISVAYGSTDVFRKKLSFDTVMDSSLKQDHSLKQSNKTFSAFTLLPPKNLGILSI
jgi:hypothetical protein